MLNVFRHRYEICEVPVFMRVRFVWIKVRLGFQVSQSPSKLFTWVIVKRHIFNFILGEKAYSHNKKSSTRPMFYSLVPLSSPSNATGGSLYNTCSWNHGMYAFSCFIDNGIHYLEYAMHGLHVSTGGFVPPELTDHLPLTFTRPETQTHKIINR